MHRDYLKEHHPIQYNLLALSGNLHTYLVDLDEQAQDRLELIMEQMKIAEGVTEELKATNPMTWIGSMNNIRKSGRGDGSQELVYGGDGMSVLEEFWYGNLDPAEYDASPSEEYKEFIRLISRNEEKLVATMTDEQKDLFSRYQDCVREFQGYGRVYAVSE